MKPLAQVENTQLMINSFSSELPRTEGTLLGCCFKQGIPATFSPSFYPNLKTDLLNIDFQVVKFYKV